MQDLNVRYQVCVFRADQKNKMTARPLIGLNIFDFSSEQNSRKLDRMQYLNVLYNVFVLGPIGKQDGLSDLWLTETF